MYNQVLEQYAHMKAHPERRVKKSAADFRHGGSHWFDSLPLWTQQLKAKIKREHLRQPDVQSGFKVQGWYWWALPVVIYTGLKGDFQSW